LHRTSPIISEEKHEVMQLKMRPVGSWLALGCLAACGAAAQNLPTVTKTGFTVKVPGGQASGPCDWASWDPRTPPVKDANGTMTYGAPGPCNPTAAQSDAASQVLGQGLGYAFEDTANPGKLILLFGDTTGYVAPLLPDPASGSFPKEVNFHAKDTMATSSTQTAADNFSIEYYTLGLPKDPSAPLFVTVTGKEYLPPQPAGLQPSYVQPNTNVSMGPYDIPFSGISLEGQTYLTVKTGAQIGPVLDAAAYSVLVKFDGVSTFTSGRTVSENNYLFTLPITVPGKPTPPEFDLPGHFVYTALAQIAAPFTFPIGPCVGNCFVNSVGIWGNGQSRASSLYFSYVPISSFWSGLDSNGDPATVYFAGYKSDQKTPKWSGNESDAQPLFWDNPPTFAAPGPRESDPGAVGNPSLLFDSNSGLWLMIYDHFGTNAPARGIYFTYAQNPWGPWQTPSLIYNACQAHQNNQQGAGDFIFYYAGDENKNYCPSALPAGAKPPAFAGPAGPVIGTADPFGEIAFSTDGAVFAPQIIGRFSGSQNGNLRLQYNISTWNPYTVVRMETNFTISNQWSSRDNF
jgi:hypothetical protein